MVHPYRVIRDAVHGDIDLTELECGVIDTPQFQRLRKVRQLGASFLVFPSAVHTRFEHSLGTLGVAQLMMDHLRKQGAAIGEAEETVVRLSALLHDIEHVPFGHTLEDDARLFERHDTKSRMTRALDPDSDVGRVLESAPKNYRKDILELLTHISDKSRPSGDLGIVRPWMVDLVGNTICADLLDYVRRDLYFCGIRDNYDDRILRAFEIDPNSNHLVIQLVKGGRYKRDIQSELLSILGLRYSLSEKVLYHHTKLAFDAMISKAVQAADITLEQLREMDDLEVLKVLIRSESTVARKIGSILETRGKYKPVFELTYEATSNVFPAGQLESKLDELVSKYSASDDAPSRRLSDEQFLETASGLESGDVIINCLRRAANLKEAEVMVIWAGQAQELKTVEQNPPSGEVDALNAKYVALWRFNVFIHPRKYEYFAVELERNVQRLINASNVLRVASPDEWKRLDQYQDALESFAREKDLRLSEYDEFRRHVLAEEVKARSAGETKIEVFKAHMAEVYNVWSSRGRSTGTRSRG